jgi:putative tryptophan/tyrosine transport system substrate-binding protein
MDMRRREFIGLIGGAAAWPVAARAQPSDAVRRVGVLMPYAEDDPEGQASIMALKQGLEKLQWTIGRNIRIDYRWGIDDVEKTRAATAELLALAPDVIMAGTSRAVATLQQATHTVPILFTTIYEPVAQGFVQSLAHPGGNITGFTMWRLRSGQSGWSFSRRSHPLSTASHSCSIRTILVLCKRLVRPKRRPQTSPCGRP